MRKRAVQTMFARSVLVGLACVAGVGLASPTEAATLFITNTENTDGSIGPEGLHAEVQGFFPGSDSYPTFDVLTIGFEHGPLAHFRTHVDPTSGELLFTEYGYADAFVVVSAQWTTKTGVLKSGSFRAPITGTAFEGVGPPPGPPTPPLGLLVIIDEDLERVFGPKTISWIYTGQGTFSNELARRLHVSRASGGSVVELILEEVKPGEGQRPLVVYLNQIFIDIEPQQVPEPTSLLLCLVGGGGIVLVRRSAGRKAAPTRARPRTT